MCRSFVTQWSSVHTFYNRTPIEPQETFTVSKMLTYNEADIIHNIYIKYIYFFFNNTYLFFQRYRLDNTSYTMCTGEWEYLGSPRSVLADFEEAGSTWVDLFWQWLSVLHMRVCRKGKKPALGRFRGPTKPGWDNIKVVVMRMLEQTTSFMNCFNIPVDHVLNYVHLTYTNISLELLEVSYSYITSRHFTFKSRSYH